MKLDLCLLPCVALFLAGIGSGGCSRSPEEKANRYLQEGKQYLGKRDYDSALTSFRNAAREMPSKAEPQFQAGLTFLAINAPSSAAMAFRAATELDRSHLGARLKLAELMLSSRDKRAVEEGVKLTSEVLAAHPDNADALSLAGLAEMRLGKAAAATEQLKQAIAKHPAHAGITLNLARSLVGQGDRIGAEKVLREGIAATPKALELVLALGDLYLQSKLLGQAEEQYRQALAIEPDHGAASLALASIQAKKGKPADAEATLTKLSRGSDKRYRGSLAAYFKEQGKPEAAITELERIYQADAIDQQTRSALVNAYLDKQEIVKAEALLATTLGRNGRDADALLQRAQVYVLKKEFGKAEEDLRKVLEVKADSSQAHFLMSKIHRSRGSTTAVRQELSEVVRLDSKLLVARLELSQILRQTGGARAALTLLDEAPAEQKQNAAFLLERNWSLLELKRFAEVRPVIEAILNVAELPEALLQRAALQAESHEYASAKATLEQALAKAPDDVRILQLMVQVYTALKDTDGGMQRIQKHVAQRPESYGLKAFIGHLLLARGDYAQARSLLEAAATAAPELMIAQLDLADLDTKERKLDSAQARLQKLTALDRDGSIHVRLAALAERQGQHDRAKDHYRAALGANSANVAALNNMAYLVADQDGNPDEALKYAQQAKELAPRDPAVDDTLGWTYYRKGLYSMAVRHLESATSKERTARRLFHLSMAYSKNGDESRGRVALDAALKMDATLPEAIAAREVLAQVRKTNREQAR